MNRDSILNGNRICEDCDFLIQSLEKEIENYHRKILALTELRDLEMLGESSSALKCRNNELIDIVRQLIDADELEIKDIRILCERVSGIYINGDEVLTNIEKARREAEACENTASSLSSAADHAVFPWEASSLRGMANASRSQADSWNRIRRHWEEQRDLYDMIDVDTSRLFLDVSGLHQLSQERMDSFLNKRKGIDVNEKNGTSFILLHRTISETKKYLIDCGFEAEEVELIYKEEPKIFWSLARKLNASPDNVDYILKQMRVLCLKDTYNVVLEDIKMMLDLAPEEYDECLYILYQKNMLELLRWMPSYDLDGYRSLIVSTLNYRVIERIRGESKCLVFPTPGSSIEVSPGRDLDSYYVEVENYNAWSVEYSIKYCNEYFPNSVCCNRLNYAVSHYRYNEGEEDLLKFYLDGFKQPVFAGAMVEGYADIGDIVSVTLDNGESFPFLILDVKSTQHTSSQLTDSQIQCEYGHGYVVNDKVQLCICEFMLSEGNPNVSALSTPSGQFLNGRYVLESEIIDHIEILGE